MNNGDGTVVKLARVQVRLTNADGEIWDLDIPNPGTPSVALDDQQVPDLDLLPEASMIGWPQRCTLEFSVSADPTGHAMRWRRATASDGRPGLPQLLAGDVFMQAKTTVGKLYLAPMGTPLDSVSQWLPAEDVAPYWPVA